MQEEDMGKVEIDEFYAFTKNPIDPDIGAIKITRGPFEGLIYVYDEYKFSKVDEDTGQPSVRFAFNVLYVCLFCNFARQTIEVLSPKFLSNYILFRPCWENLI